MIRVGYFCTAGHTEAGGMQRFLRRIDPDVDWVRCFPAISKPGPKLGRPAPRHKQGLSGGALVEEMLSRLKTYHQVSSPGALDVVLLIDDADCRFDDVAAWQAWQEDRTADVAKALGDSNRPFVALFASPEVEAWFLADWEHGLGAQYGRLPSGDKHLRSRVEDLLGRPIDDVESYGGRRLNGTCEHKLSEKLQNLLLLLGEAYSKGTQGQDMLLRIEPAKVAERCDRYFRPALHEVRRAIAAARGGQMV